MLNFSGFDWVWAYIQKVEIANSAGHSPIRDLSKRSLDVFWEEICFVIKQDSGGPTLTFKQVWTSRNPGFRMF